MDWLFGVDRANDVEEAFGFPVAERQGYFQTTTTNAGGTTSFKRTKYGFDSRRPQLKALRKLSGCGVTAARGKRFVTFVVVAFEFQFHS